MSDSVTAMTTAEIQSVAATVASTAAGNQAGEHQLRQVPGEIRVQAIQPAGSHSDDLTRLLPVQPARAKPLQLAGQPATQL